uniref:SCP domain-containing protein n=1 Tax=Strongyloides papillosus TaxID=174720 RepID=A0A0N5B3N2_STREA
MKTIAIFYFVAVLFLHFNPTIQWAKFYYITRDWIRSPFNNSVTACQYAICKAVLNAKKIKGLDEKKACNEISDAYGGVGEYKKSRFQYLEVYSIVKTQNGKDTLYGEDGLFQYIGDCVCANKQCTNFKALCIYTYWFGFKYIWNNQMC